MRQTNAVIKTQSKAQKQANCACALIVLGMALAAGCAGGLAIAVLIGLIR